jgi:predicted ArsR family transcriptional regulator
MAVRYSRPTGLTSKAMRNLDAIADPVRLRILRHLAEHDRASGAELARAAQVHENTVRPHLQALVAAELVATRPRPADGPGRPGIDYVLAEDDTFAETDFRRLAQLLSSALMRLGADEGRLRATGEDWGRWLAGRPGVGDPRDRVPAALRQLGFAVELAGDDVRLSGCPCPLVAPDRPETVCHLAAGVMAGALAGTGLRLEAVEHHPERRRCSGRMAPA